MDNISKKIHLGARQASMVLGGLLIILLLFLIFSGILLSLFYNPAPERAYESMFAISNGGFMSLVRNFHYWASDALLFVIFLHMTRVALTKPSGKPRRYAWWLGVGLLILVGTEMLVGTFLRADQESYEAYTHFFLGTNAILAKYFYIVTAFANFFSESSALLRFFIIHIILLPVGIFVLIVLHSLFAPSFRGMLIPFKKITEGTIRGNVMPSKDFWKHPIIRRLFLLTGVTFLIILVLSIVLPAPLYPAPYSNVEVTKPPWWLLWVVALENQWGLAAILFAPPALFGIFALIPFFAKDKPGVDKSILIYVATVVIVIMLSFWAIIAPQKAHTEHYAPGESVIIPAPGAQHSQH